MNVIPTPYLILDLLYYVNPQINASDIFTYFAEYNLKNNNQENYIYYKQLSEKYNNRLFKGDEKLP